jgi:hypothetical protein
MPRPRGIVLMTVLLGLVTAACTTTTSGTGSVRGGFATAGPGFPVPTSPRGSTPSSRAAVPPPPFCQPGACQQRLSASLTAPYGIAVWSNPNFNGVAVTIVELTRNGVPVTWQGKPDQTPSQLSCITSDHSNCVLVDLTGAHGSIASVWRLVGDASGASLVHGASAQAATPTMQAADLDHDGWVDVAGLQNDYTPSYAAGRVYWQTWKSDGTRLMSTGCSAPSHTRPAAPSAFESGNCP